MPQDGSVASGSDAEDVSFPPRVRTVAAAGVEETAACAGMKELSDGVRFGSNVFTLDSGVINESSGREEEWGSSVATPGEASCIEDRSSDVAMRTWAACS